MNTPWRVAGLPKMGTATHRWLPASLCRYTHRRNLRRGLQAPAVRPATQQMRCSAVPETK